MSTVMLQQNYIFEQEDSVENENKIQTEDIKFAVFDGSKEITESMYDEVKNFADFIKQREKYNK